MPNNKKSIVDVIEQRRAVYPPQFTGKTIEQSLLKDWLTLANWAPTHRRTEPWRFVVFMPEAFHRLDSFFEQVYKNTIPEVAKQEQKIEKQRAKLAKSSAILVINMVRDEMERLPEWEEIAATAMAVQNLWLATSSFGLAGYWSTPKSAIEQIDKLLPEMGTNDKALGFFYVGTVDSELPKGRRFSSIEDKSVWYTS